MAPPAKIRASVAEVVEHAAGVRSYAFATERRVPRFKPGQFLHLAIDPYDPSRHWPDSRVFSIASPPDQRELVRISVSEVGAFTRRMAGLKVGDSVWLKLPYGDFVVEGRPGEAVVLVAGGTGMAPFASLLSSDATGEYPVRVLYGARTPELLTFSSVLDDAAERWPDLRWSAFVEEGSVDHAMTGRIDLTAAVQAANETCGLSQTTFYLSGPPAMLDTFRTGLDQAGVARRQIRLDAWD